MAVDVPQKPFALYDVRTHVRAQFGYVGLDVGIDAARIEKGSGYREDDRPIALEGVGKGIGHLLTLTLPILFNVAPDVANVRPYLGYDFLDLHRGPFEGFDAQLLLGVGL